MKKLVTCKITFKSADNRTAATQNISMLNMREIEKFAKSELEKLKSEGFTRYTIERL